MTRVSGCKTYPSEATALQDSIPGSLYNLRLPGCQDIFLEIPVFSILFLCGTGFFYLFVCLSILGLGFLQILLNSMYFSSPRLLRVTLQNETPSFGEIKNPSHHLSMW